MSFKYHCPRQTERYKVRGTSYYVAFNGKLVVYLCGQDSEILKSWRKDERQFCRNNWVKWTGPIDHETEKRFGL